MFELRNARYTAEIASGKKTYGCDFTFCEDLVVVAKLTTRTFPPVIVMG